MCTLEKSLFKNEELINNQALRAKKPSPRKWKMCYRAILVQADNYLMEIVRYIHMTPAIRREDMGAYTTARMAIQSIKNRLTVEQRFRRRIEKIKKKILDATWIT